MQLIGDELSDSQASYHCAEYDQRQCGHLPTDPLQLSILSIQLGVLRIQLGRVGCSKGQAAAGK